MSSKLFPAILILLSIAAGIVYALNGTSVIRGADNKNYTAVVMPLRG